MDVLFVRLRSGDESDGDKRVSGWLGIALKSDDNPEPILNYKPKNRKTIYQINSETSELIREWSSISELSSSLSRSTTVTSSIINRGSVFKLDGVNSVFKVAV